MNGDLVFHGFTDVAQTPTGLVTSTPHAQPPGMCSLPTMVQLAGLASDNLWSLYPLPSLNTLGSQLPANTSHGSTHSLRSLDTPKRGTSGEYHSWETSTRTRECLSARTLERVRVPTRGTTSTHEYLSMSIRARRPPFRAQFGSLVTKF